MYKSRFVYNSKVVPSNIDALLVRRRHNCKVWGLNVVRPRVFSNSQSGLYALSQAEEICSTSSSAGQSVPKITHNDLSRPTVQPTPGVGEFSVSNNHDTVECPMGQLADQITPGFESSGPGFVSVAIGDESDDSATEQVTSGRVSQSLGVAKLAGPGFESPVSDPTHPVDVMRAEDHSGRSNCHGNDSSLVSAQSDRPGFGSGVKSKQGSHGSNVNAVTVNVSQLCPIYDVNNVGMEEKFVNTIIFANQSNKDLAQGVNSHTFKQWNHQVDFQFGFVPLGSQLMPDNVTLCNSHEYSPIEMHKIVKNTGKPNFLEARLPVSSQLNVDRWKTLLSDYWDQQLLQLLQFGFPLDFNRCCPLQHEVGNHSSATEFPADVDAYIEEECKFGALLGPFDANPIESAHNSPFMTRHKPNSDRRRVIIDLSWPLGASVNLGIDKNTYLDTPFMLTFPTIDDITSELKSLGVGPFCTRLMLKVDPGDYDLLGLHWHHAYIDTCVPFGTRHGSQIF